MGWPAGARAGYEPYPLCLSPVKPHESHRLAGTERARGQIAGRGRLAIARSVGAYTLESLKFIQI